MRVHANLHHDLWDSNARVPAAAGQRDVGSRVPAAAGQRDVGSQEEGEKTFAHTSHNSTLLITQRARLGRPAFPQTHQLYILCLLAATHARRQTRDTPQVHA
jgi:hypothetical protein